MNITQFEASSQDVLLTIKISIYTIYCIIIHIFNLLSKTKRMQVHVANTLWGGEQGERVRERMLLVMGQTCSKALTELLGLLYVIKILLRDNLKLNSYHKTKHLCSKLFVSSTGLLGQLSGCGVSSVFAVA